MSVSDERAKAALQLFEAALALAPQDRESWIARECSHDPEIAAEVRSLLTAHDDAGDFLDPEMTDSRIPRMGHTSEWIEIGPGCQIGDFLIERQIGAGGMGIVYRAQQISLKRPVALKV